MGNLTRDLDISGIARSQKIIIFCQAPADVPYVLTLYEIYNREYSISIFVINVEGMFQFLSDLHLLFGKNIFRTLKAETSSSFQDLKIG